MDEIQRLAKLIQEHGKKLRAMLDLAKVEKRGFTTEEDASWEGLETEVAP